LSVEDGRDSHLGPAERSGNGLEAETLRRLGLEQGERRRRESIAEGCLEWRAVSGWSPFGEEWGWLGLHRALRGATSWQAVSMIFSWVEYGCGDLICKILRPGVHGSGEPVAALRRQERHTL
jgi:hypothetical protein